MKKTIDKKQFYNRLYNMLENVTPLAVDCGQLCNGACCAVTDEVTGMYLFPGEEVMYRPMPPWGEIHEIDFTYDGGRYIDLFTCSGKCDRSLRPLSCRIFPLVPYAKRGGKLEILMDVRGKGMCPLATAMKKEDLSSEFVEKVTHAMKLCMAVGETREFIYALSDSLDEIELLKEDFYEL